MIIIIINHEVCYDIHKHNPGCAMGYIFTDTVVAEAGSFSARATNASFLRVIANLQI